MIDLYASCVPLHNAEKEEPQYDIKPFVEAACSGINDNTSEKVNCRNVFSVLGGKHETIEVANFTQRMFLSKLATHWRYSKKL